MNDTTAVVLSLDHYDRKHPGVDVLVHRSKITDSKEQQAARFDAVLKVETDWLFFLDDDDDLPDDALDVIECCINSGAPLAYTDELIRTTEGESVRRSRPYSQAEHIADPMLVHHLVVMHTATAKAAVKRLPRGHYCPEFMLFFELAKAGAAYVPGIGYVWHRRPLGLHMQPWVSMGQMRSRLWAKANS